MSLFEKNNPLSSPPVLTVLNGMQNGMLILNADMEILFWNNWVTENTGIDFTYGEGKAFKDVFPTANDKGLNRKVKSSLVVNGPVFCSSSSIGYLLQIPLKGVIDSNCKHMQQDWVIAPFDSDCVFIAIYDVTTTRESEFRMNRAYDDLNKLKQSLEQKVGLMDRYIPSLILTPEGSIRNASEAFFLLCPQDADSDVVDKRLDCFFKLSDIERELVNQVLSGERLSWEGKLTTSSIDDPICWVEVNLIRESTDVDSNITAIFRDITNEKYFEELSSIDKLTNSYNRQYFEQALLSQINSSERYETFFSLIVVDIDHFKDINDRYGHLIGDEVLIELSKIMRDSIRGCDTFARWGGEEFAVLLPQTDCRDAMITAEKCCQMIANHQFKSVGKVTASFGVAEYSCAGKEELLKKADSALYEAKTSGRNCVKHWQN